MTRLALAALALLTLTACAGAANSRYAAEVDRLEGECRARGGILTPIPGSLERSGNPGANYACTIHGGSVSRS
jgi:hypothetical protein